MNHTFSLKCHSHPYKAGWKPTLTVHDATPPPFFVGGIYDFDSIPCLKAQLLIIHGDMVPEGLCIHHTAIADQLQRKQHRGDRVRACRSFTVTAILHKDESQTYHTVKDATSDHVNPAVSEILQ